MHLSLYPPVCGGLIRAVHERDRALVAVEPVGAGGAVGVHAANAEAVVHRALGDAVLVREADGLEICYKTTVSAK